MEDGHFIDDPLYVVGVKPDFSGLGMEPIHKQKKGTMTNKEAIDRWADSIIPAVFKAEEALQKAVPAWKERLKRLGEPGGEDQHKVASEYCHAIARIIVTHGSDYVPEGTIDGEADYT